MSAMMPTGRPIADVRSWLGNTVLPPELRRVYEAEVEAMEAEITARVLEQNERDMLQWVYDFDALTGELDGLADGYDDVERRAREGRITADEMDAELVRLDARRRVLEAQAAEPERNAERIAQVATDPVATYDALLAKYGALPRPQFSFTPGDL
jgi:hypothetical protein